MMEDMPAYGTYAFTQYATMRVRQGAIGTGADAPLWLLIDTVMLLIQQVGDDLHDHEGNSLDMPLRISNVLAGEAKAVADYVQAQLLRHMNTELGITWDRLGELLGITAQAAHNRAYRRLKLPARYVEHLAGGTGT